MAKLKQLSLHDVAIDDYSFLAGCKSLNTLDLQDTSFSDCRLLAELPALKKVLLPPYSQLKYREVLKQLSCLQEIKEEKTEEPKAAEQPCGEGTLSDGSPASEEPLHLGDTAHLSIDGMGIVLFSPEVMRYVVLGRDFLTEEFTNPKQVGEHIRKGDITAFCTGGDFILWFRPGYPDSNAEKEFPVMIRLAVEVRGSSLQFGDLFWLSDWNPDFPQDRWIRPEDFDRWDWLKDGDYLVILIENQGCCRAGIRRKDLTKADPPVYVAADEIDDERWILCAGTLSGFLRAALAYEAVFAFPFHGEEKRQIPGGLTIICSAFGICRMERKSMSALKNA